MDRASKNVSGDLMISGPRDLIEGRSPAELVEEFKRQCLAPETTKPGPSLDDAIKVVQGYKAEWMRQLELVKGIPEAEARISTATHACHLILESLERLKA